jgi:hypothetical protein
LACAKVKRHTSNVMRQMYNMIWRLLYKRVTIDASPFTFYTSRLTHDV